MSSWAPDVTRNSLDSRAAVDGRAAETVTATIIGSIDCWVGSCLGWLGGRLVSHRHIHQDDVEVCLQARRAQASEDKGDLKP